MEPHDLDLEDELRQALRTAAAPVRGEGVDLEAVRRTVARRRTTRRGLRAGLALAAAAAVLALVMVAAPDRDGRVDTVDRPGRTTSTTATTRPDQGGPGASSTTATPDTEASSTTPGSSSTSSSTTSSTTASSTTTGAPPELPGFPPELTGATHGMPAWAVYLAIVDPGRYDAPELAAASAAAADAGYGGAGPSDLACDQGAPEALGRDPTSVAAAVYFGAQDDAAQAEAAFEARGHQVVAVVGITMGCLD